MAYDALDPQTPRAVFIGAGNRGPFNFSDADGNPIRIRDQAHLVVRRYAAVTDETGTALTLNVDFTVNNTDVDAVSITLTAAQAVLASTERLVVSRLQSIEDVIAIASGGDLSGPSLTAALSIMAEWAQEARRDIDRSVKVDWRDAGQRALQLAPASGSVPLGRNSAGAIVNLAAVDLGADTVVEEGWLDPLSAPLGERWADNLGYPYPAFTVTALGDGSDESATLQAQLNAAHTAGGGKVVVPGPAKTILCKNLLIYSNTWLDIDPSVTLKLPASAVNTDTILGNANKSAFTDSNIRITGGASAFDGANLQQTGVQSRFTELVGLSRVTGLDILAGFKNAGYIGLAVVGCRQFKLDVDLEGLGFNGTTTNGGPALYVSRPNGSYDQSEYGEITFRAKDCYWHGATVHGRNITIPYMRCLNTQECGLFAPDDGDTVRNDRMTILSWDIDGVTQRDISGSMFEIGGSNTSIGPGTGANSDQNGIALEDVTNASISSAITIRGWNQDSKGISPQGLAVMVLTTASPVKAKNNRISGVVEDDVAEAATVTISNASPAVITWTGHGRSTNDMVKFTTTGALPTGLAVGTKYFIIDTGLTKDAFQVSLQRGGAAVNTSSIGSGTQTCTKATTGYGAFGIGGSGAVTNDVVFEGNDAGTATYTGSTLVTTKAGPGSCFRNNTNATDFYVIPTLAGAATIDLASVDEPTVNISGTSFTCTSLGTAGVGTRRRLSFNSSGGALTHNATSLILPGARDLGIVAGMIADFQSLGSGNWIMTSVRARTEGTGSVTLSFATPGTSSFSYASQAYLYRRDGDLVYIEIALTFTPTLGTGAGALSVNGLPFIGAGGTVRLLEAYNIAVNLTFPAGTTQLIAEVNSGVATATVYGIGSNIGATALTPANLTNAAAHTIRIKGTYRTSAA